MQTPQGLDAQHGGELFPVDERCAALWLLSFPQLGKNLGRKDGA
jgi:hypothetical protein